MPSMHKDLSNKGGLHNSAPQLQPWGGKVARFKDLDNNVLSFIKMI